MYWLTGILGVLMIAAPFVTNYSSNQPAMWSSVIIGGAVLLASVLEGVDRDRRAWEYVAATLLGLAAIATPFILGFSDNFNAFWTMIGGGVLVAVLAAGRMFTLAEPEYG